jgi:hypothetical protein
LHSRSCLFLPTGLLKELDTFFWKLENRLFFEHVLETASLKSTLPSLAKGLVIDLVGVLSASFPVGLFASNVSLILGNSPS